MRCKHWLTKFILFNFSAAAFRTLSPNSSSSSDSFNDSFEQIYKSKKKANALSTNSDASLASSEASISRSTSEKNKLGEQECDELDEMFKNIDLKDTRDRIPIDWLEKNEPHLANAALLSTVFEDNESKYRSSKSVNTSSMSKNSCGMNLSEDSLNNLITTTETSKDSLELSSVTSNINVPIELNDTLEDVEYVCDEKNRYLLKPVSKTSKTSCASTSLAYSSANSSVVIVDSSPETSFATAQNDMKVIDVKDIKSEISSDISSNSYNTLTTLDSNKDISIASTVSSTNASYATARNDLKLIDTNDIKSETSRNKSVVSSVKNDSWTCLDSSDDTSITPMFTNINDTFASARNVSKQSDTDTKSEISSDIPMFSCISYPKTASFFEVDSDSGASEVGKSSEYYTAASANQSTSTISSLNSQPSVSAARYVKLIFIFTCTLYYV